MNPYTTGNCCILYQTFHSFTHNIMKENVITEVSRNKSDRQMLGATYRKVKLVENASNMKDRSEGKLAEYVGAAWHWLVQYIRRTERMWPNYQACEQHFFSWMFTVGVGCGVVLSFQEHKVFFWFIKGGKTAGTDLVFKHNKEFFFV